MSKKVKSARGEWVDFDLLKIKEQIASNPPPQEIQTRQDFIERRLRRKIRKANIPPVQEPERTFVEEDLETVQQQPANKQQKTKNRQKSRPQKENVGEQNEENKSDS